MNFHKKIGFLAALLLMFGLGVPDGFAQDVKSVGLTLSPSSVVDTDGETNVTANVVVTLVSPATANMSVNVVVSDITDPAATPRIGTAETADYSATGFESGITVVILQGEDRGTGTDIFQFDPSEDDDSDNEVAVIRARYGTGNTAKDGLANLSITEFIKSVALTLSPDSVVDIDGATDVTANVKVTLNSNVSEATSVVVVVSDVTDISATPPIGSADDYSITIDFDTETSGDQNQITVTIAANSNSGTGTETISINPSEDTDDSDNEVVVIQAEARNRANNADAGTNGKDNLNITEYIKSVALTLSPNTFEELNTVSVSAQVTVTLNSPASSDRIVNVTLSDITDISATPPIGTSEGGGTDYTAISFSTVPVTITKGMTTGTGLAVFTFETLADGDDVTDVAVIQAAVSGYTDRGNLTIREGEVEAVTLTLTPNSFAEAAGNTDVTAAVSVTMNSALTAETVVTVSLSHSRGTAEAGDYKITGMSSIPVTVAAAASGASNTGTFKFDPAQDPDKDDETVTVTATAKGTSKNATLTITDDGVSAGTITITVSPNEIRENVGAKDVVVTATLDKAVAEGTTVAVAVTTEVMGSESITTVEPSGTINISGSNSGTVTLSINPSDDDVFTNRTIKVTGSADALGYTSDTASIKVLDNDGTIGEIKIAAAPPSVTVGSTANSVKLTIDVVGLVDTPAGTKVTVSLATEGGLVSPDKVTVTLGKHPNQDPETYRTQTNDGNLVAGSTIFGVGTRGTAYLTVDGGSTAGAVVATVTASSDQYTAATRTISAFDRDAQDVSGYRVLITKPGANAWAGTGDKKVTVEIARVKDLGLSWTAFGSIRVSLYDTTKYGEGDAAAETEVADALTASNINEADNGVISFTKDGNKGKISYVAATDRLKFELQVPANKGGTAPNGQYLGVYAAADFSFSGNPTRLKNTQSDKLVFPNPTILADLVPNEADRYVGDGKFIWVDNVKPSNAPITKVDVTSKDADGEPEVGTAIQATIGDEIRVAIGVNVSSGRARFDIAGMQAQLRTVANTAEVLGKSVASKERAVSTKNFTALEAINAGQAADSLRHTYVVKSGLLKSQTSKFVEDIGKVDTPFEGDNLQAYVRVRVKDQASNWSGWVNSAKFGADSRAPKVTIRYPAADPDSLYDHTYPMRFTGDKVDDTYGLTTYLNPLVVEVDEILDKLEVFAAGSDTTVTFSGGLIGSPGDSTAEYNTSGLNSPKKDKAKKVYGEGKVPSGIGDNDLVFVPSSKNVGGTEIDLVVLATDVLGNTTKATISGVTHDAARPVIKEWFPRNSLLTESGNQFNDATPPFFTLPEDVDSVAVRFTASGGNDATEERGEMDKGEHSIDFSGKLKQDAIYGMTIFVRDRAGNVFITPASESSGMRFNSQFDNPVANDFLIENQNGLTETNEVAADSVIAGQALKLQIQARDVDAKSNAERKALTYKNAARISAMDASGGAVESVWFEGKGVDDDADNPDGMAMLNAANWSLGKRTVYAKSNKAVGFIKITVQHITSGQGDTAVVGFENAIDSLYVGAADFNGFEITAREDGVEGPAEEIWGDYTLRVVPVDRHGNPSVRAFKATGFDSLDVLDTRAKDAAKAKDIFDYKNGIDVTIVGVPTIEDFALLTLTIEPGGSEYDLVAPADRRSQTVQVKVENESIMDDDTRSLNIRSTEKFPIAKPRTPMISAADSDGNAVTGDVSIPADGAAMVTVTASGFNSGDMVTFTRNGTAMDPEEADDDGNATLDVSVTVAGTVTVSASSGQDGRYSTGDLTITFVDTPPEPARTSYADADGNPVYLVYTGDAPPDMTVDVNDFLALSAAFGSSDGDDNYNAQADLDDDGDVDVDDFKAFVASYGRTAAGPATKPLVLLPGINENAEFSLSLGSERVVSGELMAIDVSLANVEALVGYGFALNYETDKFEFVSVAPADEDMLKSTGGETLFHHIVADGQITVANGLYNGTAVSGGGDVVRFVFRVLREFEDNARFEIADGLVFDPSQLQNPAVVAGVLELQSTPREFALHQNFPNPFNPDTTIKYDLAESADVTLQIYNVLGQVVRTLVASEAQNAGRYQIRWNGMDDRGVPVSSGIYFYQISADGKFSDVRKLMLLK